MQSHKPIFLKDFGFAKLFIDSKGTVCLAWTLNNYQQSFLGQNIHWSNCFKVADLCHQHLKRIHLTCPTCKLRKVVVGELPLISEIKIHQVWEYPYKSSLQKTFFKNALSLAEMLS